MDVSLSNPMFGLMAFCWPKLSPVARYRMGVSTINYKLKIELIITAFNVKVIIIFSNEEEISRHCKHDYRLYPQSVGGT